MRRNREDEFEAYVQRRRGAILRSATALTGGDGHLAEDLVQVTLVRLYVHWSQARRGNVDAYTNRILVNLLIDEKRRPAWLREQPRAVPPDILSEERQPDTCDDPEILDALRSLPTGMRAAVVLRHVEGLSVKETATALGCRTGTVKSQTARGLAHLRNWQTSLAATDSPSFKGVDQ